LQLCLAIPGRLEEIRGKSGIVDFGGVRRTVDLSLLEKCKVGDYVIVHAGFAIQILSEEEAKSTLDLLRQLEAATD